MSRTYAVSQAAVGAIARACQAAMDGGGRVSPETLADVLAEHEPQRHWQESREMSDGEYGRLYESRFGHTVLEAASQTAEDEYQLDFARRFGFEATA